MTAEAVISGQSYRQTDGQTDKTHSKKKKKKNQAQLDKHTHT